MLICVWYELERLNQDQYSRRYSVKMAKESERERWQMKVRLLWELLKGRNQLEDLSVNAMILLKIVLKKVDKNCRLDWTELQEIRFSGIFCE